MVEKRKGFLVAGKFTTDPKRAVELVRNEFGASRGTGFPDIVDVGFVTVRVNRKPLSVMRGQTKNLKNKLKKVM